MNGVLDALVQKLGAGSCWAGEPMSRHTTFMAGGKAAVYARPANESELLEAVAICKEAGVRYFILGKGSNTLFPDGESDVVVISTEKLNDISLAQDNPLRVRAGAGAPLKHIADFARRRGLAGFEFACGIPGSLGGALRMNAGAHGGEIFHVFHSARILMQDGSVKTVGSSAMGFGYRHSVLADRPYVALSAELDFTEDDPEAVKARMDDILQRRNASQPLNFPSAGSVFKRPAPNVFAAKLIEDCGLKGRRVGGAEVSEQHSGFIVNTGGATAADITGLIAFVRDTVFEKTG
ncbi:MAG: UDP-N-acetylmuramate dehydrogenase, partial [Clostridiales bacterium]|nr:UDP-N-acetylmuramate dehydrogenase [Clostridiales bacterium]